MILEVKRECESLENITKTAKHNRTQHNVQHWPSLFKKFFHFRYQAWPINDILSHEHFLIFSDVVFNRGLICLIWMVLCVSKMEFQHYSTQLRINRCHTPLVTSVAFFQYSHEREREGEEDNFICRKCEYLRNASLWRHHLNIPLPSVSPLVTIVGYPPPPLSWWHPFWTAL